MSPTPHTAVWEDFGGLPLPRRPQRGTLRGVWCLRPSVLRCVSSWDLCVCLAAEAGSCQPAARHVHCHGAAGRAGVRTGSEPWPWGRQNSREELQASEPKYPAAGPLPRTGHQHTLQAVMLWPGCAETTLALHVAEGVKKLCRPPLWPNSERKLGDFCTLPGQGEGPAPRGGAQT